MGILKDAQTKIGRKQALKTNCKRREAQRNESNADENLGGSAKKK